MASSKPNKTPDDRDARSVLSARQLVGIVDHMPIGVFHLDAAWQFTYVNEWALELLGRERDSLLGQNVVELYPELSGTLTDQMIRKAAEKGEPVEFLTHDEVRNIWFEVNGFPSSEGVVVALRDISAQQFMAHQLRMKEMALDVAANAIVITDRDGIIQWYNEAFASAYGLDKTEALGRNPGQLIKSGVHDDAFYANMWNTILGGEVWMGEIVNRRKDGGLITEEMTITPVYNEIGEIWIFIAVKQDISVRKESERMIRRQAELIELASDSIVVCEMDGVIRFWNHRAESDFGWTRADAVGESVQRVMSWDASDFSQAVDTCMRDGEWKGEVELCHRNGDRIRCLARWTLVKGEGGRPATIMGLYSDITAHHDLTRRIERAQRLESVGTLAGGIAHDLNNLLSPILMGVEILSHGETDKVRLDVIDTMRASVERSAELVQNILTVASGAEGVLGAVDIGNLVRGLKAFTEPKLPIGIDLKVHITEEPWPVIGDTMQLHQAILNLVENSIDALPAGGAIEIDILNVDVDDQFAAAIHFSERGQFVCIRVGDDGEGMPREQIEHIFDPYFTTKKFGKGTGLGLSSTLGIARRHDGFMDIQSQVGVGTTVSVYLPARTETGLADPGPGRSDDTMARGNGELVMIVDDEESIRSVTAATLTTAGYRVLMAEDGTEAIGLFAVDRQDVALVVTDLRMPNMDGAALIRALRRMKPEVPIIAWTGSRSSTNMKEVSRLGVACIIDKPVEGRALLQAIRKALDADT